MGAATAIEHHHHHLAAGSWKFGEGVVHHVAFAVDCLDVQDDLEPLEY